MNTSVLATHLVMDKLNHNKKIDQLDFYRRIKLSNWTTVTYVIEYSAPERVSSIVAGIENTAP